MKARFLENTLGQGPGDWSQNCHSEGCVSLENHTLSVAQFCNITINKGVD